ncbi:MAG: PEP-CTERM sorting domain-containing protein [Planctomycetota bacterium]
MNFSSRKRPSLLAFTFAACVSISCGMVPMANAAVTVPSDLFVTGTYFFDTGTSFVGPNVEHSGSLYSTAAGVQGAQELEYMANFDDGGTLDGPNPVFSILTHHGGGVVGGGDGFGGTAIVTADTDEPTDFFADSDLDFSGGLGSTATPMLLSNQSTDQAYRIFISFSYDHFVDATGADAAVRSDFDVGLDGVRLFNSELISDTVDGNVIDEVELVGEAGGRLEASGVFEFDFVLSPGETQGVFLDFTQEGRPDFADGQVDSVASYFLSIDNVVAIPEPSSVAMLSMGGLMIVQRRRRG